MSTATIVKDHTIGPDTSLAILNVQDDAGNVTEYIGIVLHPPGGPVSYHTVEKVTVATRESVWSHRTMFNGRYVDQVKYPQCSAELNARTTPLKRAQKSF